MKRLICIALSVCMLVLALSGCSFSSLKTRILVNDGGWDSQRFHIELAKFIVENGYDGYELQTQYGSTPMNWQALLLGEIDMDLESWTDNIATYDEDIASGRIIDIGTLVADSAQGFYVPRYVVEGDPERGIEPMAPDLKTVKDLLKYPDLFPDPENPGKSRIYGGTPGWAIDEIMYKKYLAYGLDEDFVYFRTGSETVLFASLMSAYNLGEPWVGYCYEPTWIAGKCDLIRLEDEPYDPELYDQGLCEVPTQALKIIVNESFPEKCPDLVYFFSHYQTSSALVNEALAYLDDTGCTHEEAAVWFLQTHDELLDEWVEPEAAARVRQAVVEYGK